MVSTNNSHWTDVSWFTTIWVCVTIIPYQRYNKKTIVTKFLGQWVEEQGMLLGRGQGQRSWVKNTALTRFLWLWRKPCPSRHHSHSCCDCDSWYRAWYLNKPIQLKVLLMCETRILCYCFTVSNWKSPNCSPQVCPKSG